AEFFPVCLHIGGGDIAPRRLAEQRETVLGVLATDGISAIRKFVVDHGVGDEHRKIRVFEGNEFGFAAAAVDENQAIRFAECGGELVHDAAGDLGEVVFGFLAEQRLFLGIEHGVEQAFEKGGGGAFEGGGRRET